MQFTKLTRTEEKGVVHVYGKLVVVVFEAKGTTVIRTSAGGDNASFVVSEAADDVVKQLSVSGAVYLSLTHRKSGGNMHFNLEQIVGVYERSGTTVIRTTAGGDHAEYAVPESLTMIEGMINELMQAPSGKSLLNALMPGKTARRPSVSKGAANKP